MICGVGITQGSFNFCKQALQKLNDPIADHSRYIGLSIVRDSVSPNPVLAHQMLFLLDKQK